MNTELGVLLRARLAGAYDVTRELGGGGMATVFLADERKHGRQVAIKVLKPDLAASVGTQRFLREIRIVARLSHPHILPLIDSGDAGGLLYYVSPYVPGGSLRDRLRADGRLPIADALRIAEEVSTALDFAHRAGFVHRDVKPENILFADGQAVLADFGVARTYWSAEGEAITETGMALGTPEYMSPEQASGEVDIESRSDIYSLACVVYEMLAGEPPLRGGSIRATIAKQVVEAPRPLRALRPEVPPSVEQAVARALAKDPAARFATVAEFTEALQRPAQAGGPLPPLVARTVAVLPFVNASPDPENEYLSDGITDELIDWLSRVNGIRVASRTSVFALKGTRNDVRAVGALLGASEVLEGTVRRVGTRLRVTAQLTSTDDGRLLWSQRYDRTVDDVLAIQDELARTIVSTLRGTWLAALADPPAARQTEHAEAFRLYLKGRYAWNLRTNEGTAESIRFFERAITEDPRYALAYTGLADAYALHVDYRSVPVHEGFERAKRYARTALALDDTLAEAHASLAWSLFIHDWDWLAAEREFRRAIELNPRYATARQWYAFLLTALGRVEEALVEAHAALELDPGSVSVRRSLGFQYYYARLYERSRHHIDRAIEMNPIAEESYRTLGLALSMEGRHEEAQRALREAMRLPGAGTYTAGTLAYALAAGGRRDEAMEIVTELERRAGREYVSPVAFATASIGLGDVSGALDWAERARAERRGWLVYWMVNPLVDPLRADPRFDEIAAAMRLPGSGAVAGQRVG